MCLVDPSFSQSVDVRAFAAKYCPREQHAFIFICSRFAAAFADIKPVSPEVLAAANISRLAAAPKTVAVTVPTPEPGEGRDGDRGQSLKKPPTMSLSKKKKVAPPPPLPPPLPLLVDYLTVLYFLCLVMHVQRDNFHAKNFLYFVIFTSHQAVETPLCAQDVLGTLRLMWGPPVSSSSPSSPSSPSSFHSRGGDKRAKLLAKCTALLETAVANMEVDVCLSVSLSVGFMCFICVFERWATSTWLDGNCLMR